MTFGNFTQLFYIWGSIAMTIMHIILNPFHLASKLIMIFVIMLSITRTFKLMRILSPFAHIVEMLFRVVYDLISFIFFYLMITILFSMLFSVMGLANIDV